MTPERALWSAVLRQAIVDARKGDKRAMAWFSGASADFRTVCDFAGVDPDAVQGRVLAGLPRVEGPAGLRPLLDRLAALRKVAA